MRALSPPYTQAAVHWYRANWEENDAGATNLHSLASNATWLDDQRFSGGGCELQAKAHAGANLSVGNTRQTLIEALTPRLYNAGLSDIPHTKN